MSDHSGRSGYCKSRSRPGLTLDSRLRSIFRNFPTSEMPAVQFSNCENLHISFERKHYKEMNGENMWACLGGLHS